jgi:hypothetical protein
MAPTTEVQSDSIRLFSNARLNAGDDHVVLKFENVNWLLSVVRDPWITTYSGIPRNTIMYAAKGMIPAQPPRLDTIREPIPRRRGAAESVAAKAVSCTAIAYDQLLVTYVLAAVACAVFGTTAFERFVTVGRALYAALFSVPAATIAASSTGRAPPLSQMFWPCVE